MQKTVNILLGVSGSVSAYKAVYLSRHLIRQSCRVQVVMTPSATQFITPLSFSIATGRPAIVSLWEAARQGDVGHVKLADEYDVVCVAPASADTLARLAHGRANDALVSTVLSSGAPMLLAPAMETKMWEDPATQAHIKALTDRGALVVPPTEGALASGAEGIGRLADVEDIALALERLWRPQDLAGKTVLVTAGPTREFADPVRCLTNPSTGRMGFSCARACYARGADVRLVSGPTELKPPPFVETTAVTTTEEMLEACRRSLEGTDAWIMAAAPSDFRPLAPSTTKLKKQDAPNELSVEHTPDILRTLRSERSSVCTIGFAAETDDVVTHAKDKLSNKGLQMVVANQVGKSGQGFAAEQNEVTLVSATKAQPLPRMSKNDVAHRIVDAIHDFL